MSKSKRFHFAELKNAADLYRKLEHDFAELQKSEDPYAAFNFFVTAEHFPDWTNQRKPHVKAQWFLRVVSHIANGAKHLEVDRHDAVTGTEKQRYVEKGYVEEGYFQEPFLIHLAPAEAQEYGKSSVDAVTLGKMVMAFWKPYA